MPNFEENEYFPLNEEEWNILNETFEDGENNQEYFILLVRQTDENQESIEYDDEMDLSTLLLRGWKRYSPDEPDFEKFVFSGQKRFIPDINKPMENELNFFQFFFDDELLQEIVDATNLYVFEFKDTESIDGVYYKYYNISISEMKAFLGIFILMGIDVKPEIKDYFSNNSLLRQNIYRSIFTRHRFLQIYYGLQIPSIDNVSNTRIEKEAYRSLEFIQNLCIKFKKYYCPGPNIVVDESTVPFKGFNIYKVYTKNKPTKFGIRIYNLSESRTGYSLSMIPYFGKLTQEYLKFPELNFFSRIVLHLVNDLLLIHNYIGYHIYTDRLFSNMVLIEELYKLCIHFTGTIQLNKKMLPYNAGKKKLKLNEEYTYRKDDKYMLLLFKDKRIISILSSYHNNIIETKTKVYASGYSKSITKPIAISDYTNNMGGVDLNDHYTTSYSFNKKTKCWFKKILIWMIDVSIVISFILFNIHRKSNNKPEISHKNFRLHLVHQLIGDFHSNGTVRHGKDFIERLNGKIHHYSKSSRPKDCRVCSNRNVMNGRKQTIYFCETCSNKPPLHIGICSTRYHSKENYKI